MPRIIHIDHRPVPRSQTAPRRINPATGQPESVAPERPFVPEEQQQLQRRAEHAEARAAAAEETLKVQQAETEALKATVQAARDESTHLRHKVAAAKNLPPRSITLVSIDDIVREQDIARVQGICQVNNVVGEVELVLPMRDLLRVIKSKKGGAA
jgi:arylamine N-acetyltransferase